MEKFTKTGLCWEFLMKAYGQKYHAGVNGGPFYAYEG